jgi:hypothetical protein
VNTGPDWPPQISAVGLPDGERRYGSTGQSFEVKNGQWVRRESVWVGCRIVNGIMIRLSKPGFDDGTGDGMRPMIHDGPGVRLKGPSSLHTGAGATERADLQPEFTEVDAEWFAAWLEQHKLDPLVAMEQVYLYKEETSAK